MFTEDLDSFLDSTSGFAVDATYNGGTAVKVLFDEPYSSEAGIGSTDPSVIGKASDFPVGTSIGKTLLVNATTYVIRAREPIDDGALVRLQLEVQS